MRLHPVCMRGARAAKRCRRLPLVTRLAVAVTLILCPAVTLHAGSWDAGACCADLGQRILDLEQSLARSGRPSLELTVSGTVNHAFIFWDDGSARDAYITGGESDGSALTFDAETSDAGQSWSAGITIELELLSAGSGHVSQSDTDGARTLEASEVSLWMEFATLGQVAIGATSARGSSGANEHDLSGTESVAYAGVADIGGGFLLRAAASQSPSHLTDIAWEGLIGSLDEPDGNAVTYSSPEWGGLTFSALWGEDDVWSAALGYDGAWPGGLEVSAGIAVSEDRDGSSEGAWNSQTLAGSLSVLETGSGINVTVSGGVREVRGASLMNSGTRGLASGASYVYAKAGWRGNLTGAGETRIYVEAAHFSGFLGADADAAGVASLTGIASGPICAGAGVPCFVSDSDAGVFGFGAVQAWSDIGVQLYAGYRRYGASIGLTDSSGRHMEAPAIAPLQTLMTGVVFEF